TFNPILRIQRQLIQTKQTPLLEYQSNDPDPAYLRMTALDRFDGSGWTQGDLTAPNRQRVEQGMPNPFGLGLEVATTTIRSSVRATNSLDVPWWPVPYPAVSVSVDKGDWRWDDTSRAIFSTQTTTKGRSWTVTSRRPRPTAGQLNRSGGAPPLSVRADTVLGPNTVPEVLNTKAIEVTRGAKTPFAQAVALQDYFHSSHFHYTTDAPSDDSKNVLAAFLRDGQGYCVQFAAAMALMARVLHIPSRVAIGFTRGVQQSDG